MSELQENLTNVITNFFNEISKINVAGTSLSQHLEQEVLDKVKAKLGNSMCEKCKCCTSLRNAVPPSNDYEITENSEQNDNMETSSMPYDRTPRRGATKSRRPYTLPTTQKTRQLADCSCKKSISFSAKKPRIRRPDSSDSLEHTGRARKKIVAQERSNCSLGVRAPRDRTPKQGATKRRGPYRLPTTQKTRQLADRSCKKNISYSAKIPRIRRTDSLDSLVHTGRARKKIVAQKRSNCSLSVPAPRDRTPRQGATKRRWPYKLPTTQKTRQLADRSCKKNISYSAKIPRIRRPDSSDNLEHTGRTRKKIVAQKRSNSSLGVPAPRDRKIKPGKKLQKEGSSGTVFWYKKFKGGRIDKSVSVIHKRKQYQIKQKKLSKALLIKLARTAGTGETMSSSFLKKHSLNLVNPKRKTLYSPSTWMSSPEFTEIFNHNM